MRMGAAMMRLSNLHLTPALTGLIMVTVLLLGAIVVRVTTVSEQSEVRTHTIRETGAKEPGSSRSSPPDIGVADLKGSLQ